MVTELANYTAGPIRTFGANRALCILGLRTSGANRSFEARGCQLARAAAPGAEALDLASFRGRDVVRTPAHLAHEPLLLHLAAELP